MSISDVLEESFARWTTRVDGSQDTVLASCRDYRVSPYDPPEELCSDAHPKSNATRWGHWPAELVDVFKPVTLAFLEHPVPRSVTVASGEDLMSVGTLSFRLRSCACSRTG